MERVDSYDFFMQLAETCVGLPRIFAAVILLNRPDFHLEWPEEILLRRYIEEGKFQLRRRLEGEKV
jgi:hypothetical protein